MAPAVEQTKKQTSASLYGVAFHTCISLGVFALESFSPRMEKARYFSSTPRNPVDSWRGLALANPRGPGSWDGQPLSWDRHLF